MSKEEAYSSHSPTMSADAEADGPMTFFTSGSTVQVSYLDSPCGGMLPTNDIVLNPLQPAPKAIQALPSMASKANNLSVPRQRFKVPIQAQNMQTPGYAAQRQIEYKAKAHEEIASTQIKPHELGLDMEKFRVEYDRSRRGLPAVTDAVAHARIAAQPKLAWILGDDQKMDIPNTKDSHDTEFKRPQTAHYDYEKCTDGRLQRNKSSDTLHARAHRLDGTKTTTPIEPSPGSFATFYCTFCSKRFSSQIEWTRHEKEVHLLEDLWLCCPSATEDLAACPFCEELHPTSLHLAYHHYQVCRSKEPSERVFASKTDFMEHVLSLHKVSPIRSAARLEYLDEAWRRPSRLRVARQALHCGFCGIISACYQDRTEHVSRHFLAGADMHTWWNERVSYDVVVGPECGSNCNQ